MQNIKLNRKGRKGFTLVEVALAVAVGLIVIGGAIVGFNAVRENASNSAARQKVDAAVGIVENIAASSNQIYPASTADDTGRFSLTWKAQRPDFNANPWGGINADPVDGVTEIAAGDFGANTETAAAAATPLTAPAVAGTVGAGNLIYRSASGAQPWGVAADIESGTATNKVVKGYVLSLYNKSGAPFWYVKGGK
jgi:prepilin-type N-terminal cleavage/methylation domain-containing protein